MIAVCLAVLIYQTSAMSNVVLSVGSKKLKCSGEQPSCARCVRENIKCTYSPQSRMGRPKKRQRADDNIDNDSGESGLPFTQLVDPELTNLQPGELQAFENNAFSSGNGGHRPASTVPDVNSVVEHTLQPWMLPGGFDFDLDALNNHGVDNAILPDLTPDGSSHDSPPVLSLPPELQNIPQTIQNSIVTPSNDTAIRANSSDDQSPLPTCACLSTLYLTLSNLTTMDPAFPFPTSLHPLREAMLTASQVMTCPSCPKRFITGLQNVSLLNALLMSLADRFSRILTSISNEATTLEAYNASVPATEQKTKTFRLADLSTPGHLHTGGIGCAAAFNLSLSPAEWRSMVKKVVRAEVHGPADGNECCPCLLGLIAQMEKRQDRWHQAPPAQDFPRGGDGEFLSRDFRLAGGCGNGSEKAFEKEEHLCLKMLAGTRRMVESFDWT